MSRILLVSIIVLALASILLADVPRTISYQGRLTDNGIPVNGLKSVRFRIYDGSSNPIWNSGTVGVTFTDGLFTVELGKSPQTPLPLDVWPSDTAMSLGVTIESNPELSPRLHFKTVPYALHALTAGSANSAGGWLHNNGLVHLASPNDSVSIGPAISGSKVAITAQNYLSALRIRSDVPDIFSPAMEVLASNTTGAIFRSGPTAGVPAVPIPAADFTSYGPDKNAAIFTSQGSIWPTIMVGAYTGDAIRTGANGYGIDAWSGKGIRAAADSATCIRAESNCGNATATVLSSVYTGSASYDHIAVSGYSRPADYYGIGGKFEGGYIGVDARVNPTANMGYMGVRGSVFGGSGTNYGVAGSATGAGTNLGVYGYATGGALNLAGYFDGDILVSGNITKSASTLAIDHPTDPDNEFLQQAEVVSDNLKAVYDGIVTLGADGAAIVQLPDYIESFCGDFRYQLTCVGGYAPVYVSSKIEGSKFAIAGGTSGLEVSWQITGLRKDKYAQANPLEVEKKKSPSEQGKYMHPQLYGYGAERGLSPNPAANAELKAKDDAVRAATEGLKKPSTPPAQPQMVEKK
jgi:hypothetical protein